MHLLRSISTGARTAVGLAFAAFASGCVSTERLPMNCSATEVQITSAPTGHLLTNVGAWSPDGCWLAYDVRSDAAGDRFDGDRIEAVNVATGAVRVLYQAGQGARCGVVTWHPQQPQVVFIHGPELPTADWSYGPYHREGVVVTADQPRRARRLDARNLIAPFTPGALRGGSHVHVFNAAADLVSFTYEDHVLAALGGQGGADLNQRNLGVTVVGRPVTVPATHPRNHAGDFSVVVTRTVNDPRPDSDEIKKAFEESWVGTHGYLRPDGSRQPRALAFQGQVVTADGASMAEVFLVDLPDDLTRPGDEPLAGTATRRPRPPQGVAQRRLTFTATREFPGLQGPRHWLRSSPDGSRIAFLMRDLAGVVQLWTVSPNGGAPRPLTRNPWGIASAFTWSSDGRWLAHVADNSICVTDAQTGTTHRLTPRLPDTEAPRPEACVFAPDSRRIAYVRRVSQAGGEFNQLFVTEIPASLLAP
jgi:hypothetical protein